MIYFSGRSLFIHIPRTGGMSISKAVLDWNQTDLNISLGASFGPFKRHAQANHLKHCIRDFESIKKITVIRNPWRMIESTYRLFADVGMELQKHDIPEYTPQAKLRFSAATNQTFEQFVLENFTYLEQGFYAHWCMDWNSYADLGVNAFKFETLEHNWPEIRETLCLPTEASRPHVNTTTNEFIKNINWTPKAINFICARCEIDFDRFGYPRSPFDEST